MYLSHEQSTIFCILFCKLFYIQIFFIVSTCIDFQHELTWILLLAMYRQFSTNTTRQSKYLVPVFRIRIHWVRIRVSIQHFRLNNYPDPGFWYQKLDKNLIFWSKIAVYLSLASIKDVQAKRSSLQPFREHPALQNTKFLNFFPFF